MKSSDNDCEDLWRELCRARTANAPARGRVASFRASQARHEEQRAELRQPFGPEKATCLSAFRKAARPSKRRPRVNRLDRHAPAPAPRKLQCRKEHRLP